MKKEFQKNKEWVDSQRESLKNLYLNKYIVVYGQEVVNSFDSYESAVNFSVDNYGINGFFYIEFLTSDKIVNFIMQAVL